MNDDLELISKYDIESMQTDLKKATSAHSYSWIEKSNTIRKLMGDRKLVLDVGCGVDCDMMGYDSIIGVDLSESFTKAAKKHTEKPIIRASAYALPFKSSSFGGIINVRKPKK